MRLSTIPWASLALAYGAGLASCGPTAGGPTAGRADGGSNTPPGADGGGCAPAATSIASSATPPTGTQLEAGNDLSVRGVTADGYVVYSDDAALTLHAVPLAGGATQDLGSLGPKFWVTMAGSTAFAWSNVSGANVGALTVWSSATGPHGVAQASFGIVATASPQGNQIAYVDNVDASGSTGDVYVAASDGTGKVKLLAGVYVAGCYPQLGFAGSYLVASHCDASPSGAPSATISSFASPGWTRADLVTSAANLWSADAAGTEVLVATGAGVFVVPIAGGQPQAVDPEGFQGSLSADGLTAYYSTTSHAFRRSPVHAPAPVTLVGGNFGGLYALSANEEWALYFNNLGASGGDVFLASAATAGSAVALSTAQTGGVRGDAFTADSSHALYWTNVDPCAGAGALNAVPVGGGASGTLGQNAWSSSAGKGSTVIYNDAFVPDFGLRLGRADIKWVDTGATAPPTTVVSQADAVMALSPARDAVIYAWSAQPGPLAGLYVTPLP